jgi:PAS domain S-box-containing protein
MSDSGQGGPSPAGAPPGAVEDRLCAVLDHAADAILVIGTDGRIENVNLAAEQLTGWSEADLLGYPVETLMPPAFAAGHQASIDRYLREGVSGILNVGPRPLPLQRSDGQAVPIELSVGEAWIAGERKFIGVCRDIRQRLAQEAALRQVNADLEIKVAELEAMGEDLRRLGAETERAKAAAESASQAKSRFVATMSHELRTPLNGILAVADALAGHDLAPADIELVEIIRSSGQGLLSILNEVLDLARLEAGALTLETGVFSPAETAQAVARVWRFSAEAKGLALRLETGGLPAFVTGDAGRLRQVLSNLVNNAIKFTERGEVALSVRRAGPGRLAFEVSDSGPGIAPADRERFFQPFTQAETGLDRRHGGTGLGLTICRELTALMGGEIRAQAAAGGGACFVVELPLPDADSPPEALQADGGPAPEMAAAPLILVAEDHPLNRRVAAIILEGAGLAFEFAEDGRAAVEAAASGRFGLILMDVQMPVMDGLVATRTLRQLAGYDQTPVVAMTANAFAEDKARCLEAGMNDFVAKPVNPRNLYSILLNWLRNEG